MRRERRLWSASNSGYLFISSKPTQLSDMATPLGLTRLQRWTPRPNAAGLKPGGPPHEVSETSQPFFESVFDRRQQAGGVGAVVRNGKPRDAGVDQGRLAGGERGAERILELAQALHAKA